MQVHARGKKVEDGLDWHKVARATAGFTGAELMNLMNTAAIVAVRRGAKIITEADVFQACACACLYRPSDRKHQEHAWLFRGQWGAGWS